MSGQGVSPVPPGGNPETAVDRAHSGRNCRRAVTVYANNARGYGLGTTLGVLRAATLKASAAKFRPVLMSSAASLFGMLPMALGGGLGPELRAAIGIGSVGGILLSAVVSLYLIPALTSLARR